ncbi:hypothetical protein BJAS_P1425 [Bathymodiolus japonicus methanotrophic gill symbiont]|uniref:hypothetical protein n=1 Tax=Bathymodiolus japonicus methanotrophic gill symbiont TaxID=113269 RepID=UPI001B5A03B4|nr:hypothetical protein [Bathymodiolus japonicus methanotrophic gill symbiont]GFO71739.1 hypothetical protein BJAS_P1425 [Bathymodiolus japonicus methanotrophic gill symbiont]
MKLMQTLIVAVTLLFAATANAKIELEDNSKLLGKWNLYAEAASLHKEKVELFSVWDFRKDGIIHTESEDRFGRTKTLVIDLKYSVENGNVMKQKNPGRSKMDTCSVVKMEGREMIMKCPFVYLFFKR